MNYNDVEKVKELYGRKQKFSDEIHHTYFVWSIFKFFLFIIFAVTTYLLCLIIQIFPMAGPALAIFIGIKGAQMWIDRFAKK